MIASSPTPAKVLVPRAVPTPLENGQHGFAAGWLRTTLAVLLQPKRFFSTLGTGALYTPLAYSIVSLTIPIAAAEIGNFRERSDDSVKAGIAALTILAAPVLASAFLVGVQATLFQRVLKWFGAAPMPTNLAQRAMCYLTALAATLGLLMTLTGFAPESGPCVIAWYTSLNTILALVFYALVQLARGPYGLPTGKAIGAVLAFEAVLALVVFVLALAFFAATA